MTAVLEVNKLTMDFGGLRALDQVDLDVQAGEIVALIGPNGAGKTTFFNCITGIYEPTGGSVLAQNKQGQQKRLNGLKPNSITEVGLARTFQNIRLFANMTVLENVMVGKHCRMKSGILSSILRTPGMKAEEERISQEAFELLKRVGLAAQASNLAKNLAYASQRKLEIARALATEPTLLLLDEPAAGMNPQETRELDELITSIRTEDGIAILLIEHDMRLIMSISDRIFVMDYGKKIAQGSPSEVQNNPAVIKAYLGEEVEF